MPPAGVTFSTNLAQLFPITTAFKIDGALRRPEHEEVRKGFPVSQVHLKNVVKSSSFLYYHKFPHITPTPQALQRQPTAESLPFNLNCTPELVATTTKRMKAWKAPGPDGLPIGFLKAVGNSFYKTLARIIEASLQLGYFPSAFKKAIVIVLPKPNKTAAQKQRANAWRPISLLNCMGKIMEAIVGQRLADVAERHGLLPPEQFGNRPARSTELAIKFVTNAVHTAWAWRSKASLLQLDLKGAFDTVHHGALIAELEKAGFPPSLLKWLLSFLSGRIADLTFDGASKTFDVPCGVPQGSPLSPILFILFLRPLYDKLRRSPNVQVVGYADDTNIIAYARTHTACIRALENAWDTAAEWAYSMGMEFEPAKCELLHFTRGKACEEAIRLKPIGPTTSISSSPLPCTLPPTIVHPVRDARFLGVWLDYRLSMGPHVKAVKRRMETQVLALSRLAASAWGCPVKEARDLYTVAIRSAITYAAGAVHSPTNNKLAKGLAPTQNRCLRRVLGAFKHTPIRHLEVEAYCPPLDIYLDMRLAKFELRLKETGMDQLLRDSSRQIAHRLRNRRGRKRKPSQIPNHAQWAEEWAPPLPPPPPRQARPGRPPPRPRKPPDRFEVAIAKKWKERWDQGPAPRDGPMARVADYPLSDAFRKGSHRRLYEGLDKAQSSLLAQARTGKIGLNAFLHSIHHPDFPSPDCPCGLGIQTVEHLLIECADPRSLALRELGYSTLESVHIGLSAPASARAIAQTLSKSEWFPCYGVAKDLRARQEIIEERARLAWERANTS